MSAHGTASLPSPDANASASANTASSTICVRTTSISFISGAGLKKCRPTTRSGRPGGRGDGRHRQGAGVGGEDGLGPADAVQLGEQRLLRLQLLDDRLDHDAGAGQRGQVGGRGQAAARRLGVGGRHQPLLDPLREPGLDLRDAGVDEPLLDVARDHDVARLQAHLGDAGTHGAEPHYTDGSDRHAFSHPLASAVIVLAAEAGNRRCTGYTGSMARFRDRLRVGGRDRNDAVVIDDGPGTEIIVLDAVEEVVDGVEPGVLAAAEPHPAATGRALRRQRQGSVGLYQTQITDLGGLVVEMARRGVHNHALVERRAADVVELERRIAELDGRIVAASDVRRGHVTVPPLMAQLEAPAAAASPCATCHALLVNDANFCAYCGAPRERR